MHGCVGDTALGNVPTTEQIPLVSHVVDTPKLAPVIRRSSHRGRTILIPVRNQPSSRATRTLPPICVDVARMLSRLMAIQIWNSAGAAPAS